MLVLLLTLSVDAAVFAETPSVPQRCGTPTFLRETLSRPQPLPGPPTTDLVDHESHGEIANKQYSEHFALKWGPDAGDLSDTATRILNDFEFAHGEQVENWGMDDPTGTSGTFFNVYIGDTGGDVPSVYGNAGYYTTDSAGYPMIVLNRDYLGDVTYIRSVIVHEFFHAVQHKAQAYYYEDTGSWYWEATAEWAAGQLTPESDAFFNFLPWYALKPQYGLYHFSRSTYDGLPPDLHQYGAFIFPWYISEVLGVSEAILSSWRMGTETDDPIQILEEILTEDVVSEAIVGHAARSIAWDYEYGDRFGYTVSEWAGYFSDEDNRFTAFTPHAFPDFYTIPEARWPRAGGYAVMPLPDGAVTAADRLTVLLEYDDSVITGSMPDHIDMRAMVVEFTADGTVYHTVRNDIPHTNFWLTPDSDVWIAVANTGLLSDGRYPAPFRLSFLPLPDAPEPEPEDTGNPEDTGIPEDTGNPTDTGDPPVEPVEPEEDEEPADYVGPAGDTDEKTSGGCIHAQQIPNGPWFAFGLAMLWWRRRDSPKV